MASAGTTARMAARISFRGLRAGLGTRARYSSTFFEAVFPLPAEPRLAGFTFFIWAMLQAAEENCHHCSRRAGPKLPLILRDQQDFSGSHVGCILLQGKSGILETDPCLDVC